MLNQTQKNKAALTAEAIGLAREMAASWAAKGEYNLPYRLERDCSDWSNPNKTQEDLEDDRLPTSEELQAVVNGLEDILETLKKSLQELELEDSDEDLLIAKNLLSGEIEYFTAKEWERLDRSHPFNNYVVVG